MSEIRKHGWMGTYVPVGDIGFAYTTGFQDSVGAADIIMFGVSKVEAIHIAREVYEDLKSGALVLTDQARWPPEESPNLTLREVHPTQIRREHFNVSIWRQNHRKLDRRALRAFQLVFPDTAGIFPWEPGYDLNYRPRQAALYLPYLGPPDEG